MAGGTDRTSDCAYVSVFLGIFKLKTRVFLFTSSRSCGNRLWTHETTLILDIKLHAIIDVYPRTFDLLRRS